MGKDREGKFHPSKGKPSGAGKEEGLGLRKSFNPDDLERDEQVSSRYTPVDDDQLSPDVHVRHPNRNTSKGDDFTRSEEPANRSVQQMQNEEFAKTTAEELVGIIPRNLFSYLSGYAAEVCVSIIMPTHASGVEVNEQVDLINFKNTIQQVEKLLQEKNFETTRIKKMLEPAYEILRDDKFWKNLSHGLAVYMSDDFLKFIRLPGTVSQQILVNSSFLVSPLIPFMVRKEFFYILVISKKNPKFYRADAFGIEHIPVEELPVAVDDVVRFENKDDHKLFRTSTQGAGSGANFHGIGAGRPDEKQNIATYLEEVDDTLWETHLKNSTAPLLLAGLDHLLPIYRSVSDYKYIWPESLTGNYQAEDTDSLYGQSVKTMQPYLEQGLRRALDDFGNKSATPLTSTNKREIIPAAFYGRISHLFIQRDSPVWGTFREDSNELSLTDSLSGEAENLADRAVAKTIQTGGDVYLLDHSQMPQKSQMAAIFRY